MSPNKFHQKLCYAIHQPIKKTGSRWCSSKNILFFLCLTNPNYFFLFHQCSNSQRPLNMVYFNCVYNELAYSEDPWHIISDANSFRTHLCHSLGNGKMARFSKEAISRVRRYKSKQLKLNCVFHMRNARQQHAKWERSFDRML